MCQIVLMDLVHGKFIVLMPFNPRSDVVFRALAFFNQVIDARLLCCGELESTKALQFLPVLDVSVDEPGKYPLPLLAKQHLVKVRDNPIRAHA